MAVDIKLKRSAVPGKVPTVSSLELGELALNTSDGKVFMKQQVGVTESIIELASTSGSIASASYADYAANAGNATTADYATNAGNATNADLASFANSSSYAENSTTAVSASYVASASYALSSSFATNATLLDNTGSLSFINTGSFNTFSSSITTRVSNLEAFSSSLDATYATDAQLNAATASLSSSISSLSSSFLAFSGSFNTGSFTGFFTGSFSGSLANLQGTPTHIPYFSSSQVLADSAIFQVDNGGGVSSIAINQNDVSGLAPEALFVYQPSTSSFNVISGKGNLNNYLQLNIQNENNDFWVIKLIV